jgi:hypothetical protein
MSEITKLHPLDVSRTASTDDDADDDLDYEQTWDDSSIDTKEDFLDEAIYAIWVATDKDQKASDLGCYKETVSCKRWFDAHVLEHPSTVCATSEVAKLCGITLKIYYRPAAEQGPCQNRRRRHRRPLTDLPVNKVATMLTFHPDTGLYDHLIRGKAYIVINDGTIKTSKRTVWMLQELISEYKGKYHQYGADFSREGQMQLLKACVQFKKGKWVPRSVYGIALAQTPDVEVAVWRDQQRSWSAEEAEESAAVATDTIKDGAMQRSPASHWFISAYSIQDLQDASTVILYKDSK